MNSMKPEIINYRLTKWAQERSRYELCEAIIRLMGDRLSDDVSFSPFVYISITVTNREDLKTLMELAPVWKKSASPSGIIYAADYGGHEIQIQAQGDALPGTCKLVEEEYEVPEKPAEPAKPAHKAKRMVLKCEQPEAANVAE